MENTNDLVVYIHNKTGNRYMVIYSQVTECTNGREDIDYVVYTNGDKIFCREASEFYQKFTKYKCYKNNIS